MIYYAKEGCVLVKMTNTGPHREVIMIGDKISTIEPWSVKYVREFEAGTQLKYNSLQVKIKELEYAPY